MPESSAQGWQTGGHEDVSATATMKLRVAKSIESGTSVIWKVPSMALDSGIPAGMTAFLACPDLCITMSAERGNDESPALRCAPCGLHL